MERVSKRAALVVVGVALTCFIAVVGWFLSPAYPTKEEVAAADAVVVVAGANDGRHALGAQLAAGRPLVVSNPGGERDKPGHALCMVRNAHCLDPHPATTAGEAQTTQELIDTHGWGSLMVVTNRPHARRVEATFRACTSAEIVVAPVKDVQQEWVLYQLAREMGGFMKFWVTQPCQLRPTK